MFKLDNVTIILLLVLVLFLFMKNKKENLDECVSYTNRSPNVINVGPYSDKCIPSLIDPSESFRYDRFKVNQHAAQFDKCLPLHS